MAALYLPALGFRARNLFIMAHIALFLPNLNVGGAERVMLLLAREFRNRGHTVEFILAHSVGPLVHEVPEGVSLVNLNVTSRSKRPLSLGFDAIHKLAHHLRQARPDALLSTLTGANLAAVAARQLANVRTRLVLREANSLENLRSRWNLALIKLIYPWADVFVAITDGIRKDLVNNIRIPDERIRQIYNPIDIEDLTRKSNAVLDHPWFIPNAPPVVMAVGRLVPQKGFDTLLQAFATVRQRILARLIILGEGTFRKDLETIIHQSNLSEDVLLPGFVSNPYPYIKQSALFVLSSRWEGFPNVLLEALVLKTSIVATDCHTGPREILATGHNAARLVPVGNAPALAAAMLSILEKRQTYQAIQTQEIQRFAPAHIVPAYLDVLLSSTSNLHERI